MIGKKCRTKKKKKMRIINPSKSKIEKHIDYCEYELQHLNRYKRFGRDKKPYYFKKQIEVAKRKLR